jgi:hypothetical protein
MNIISIDIGRGVAGVAYFEGESLLGSFIVRPKGAKGKYLQDKPHPSKPSTKTGIEFACKQDVWLDTLQGSGLIQSMRPFEAWDPFRGVVMEKAIGNRSNVINAQAEERGYLKCLCDQAGLATKVMGQAEWRRVVKEQDNFSWPAKGEDKKRAAVVLVRQIYHIDVTQDEADAILMGRAAIFERFHLT